MDSRIGLLIGVVIATLIVFVFSRSRARQSLDLFLVADRKVPFLLGSVSVSANWVQAIALLVSAQFAFGSAYNYWTYVITGTLAYMLFGILAPYIQERMPSGYTVPQFMGEVYGPSVRFLYVLSSVGACLFVITITMTALQQWVTQRFGISRGEASGLIGFTAFAWVVWRGMPSAIIGDCIKVFLVTIGIVWALALEAHSPNGGYASLVETLSATGSPWDLWFAGIAIGVSGFGGAVTNPDVCARGYALKRSSVRNAFFVGAAFYAVTVLAFGLFGPMARQLGLNVSGVQSPALAVLLSVAPEWVDVVTVAIVVILIAALASMLESAGDLFGIEVFRRARPRSSDTTTIWWSRGFMFASLLFGVGIAIWNPRLVEVQQSIAVVRGEAVVPLVLAVFCATIVPRAYVFWGMIIAWVGGLGFTLGNLLSESIFGTSVPFLATNGRPIGALVAIGAPLLTAVIAVTVRKFQSAERSAQPA